MIGGVVLGLVAAVVFFVVLKDNPSPDTTNSQTNTIEVPLRELGITPQETLLIGTGTLTVNGPITARDTLIISPSGQPSKTSPGQLYYDQSSNTLAYFNGTRYVTLTDVDDAATAQATAENTIDTSSFLQGAGADGAIARFAGAALTTSLLRESANTISLGGDLQISGQLSLAAPLSVANGGTGVTALQANGIVVATESGSLGALTSALPNLCLMSTSGAPAFTTCPGGGGVLSLNGLTGALNLADATASGSTITLNDASTAAKGIARFNSTNFSVSTGLVNTIQDIAVTARPAFAGLSINGQASGNVPALAVSLGAGNSAGITIDTTAIGGALGSVFEIKSPYYGGITTFQLSDAGDLVLGGEGTGGGATGSITLYNAVSTHTTTLATLDSGTADRLIRLPNGSGTLCLQSSAAACGYAARGANSDITSLSGLTTALTVGQGGTGRTTFTTNGVLFGNATGGLLATAAGTSGQCLVGNTGAAPSWGTCIPGSGSAVTSLNSLTGGLTIANASAAGSTITLNDASTSQKGIAQFNATNFTASSGLINLIQDITTASTPTFGQLTLTSSQASAAMLTVNNTDASGTGNLIDLQLNGSSRLAVTPGGNLTVTGTVNGQTISSTANFTGTLTVAGTLTANTITPTGALTVGAANQSFTVQGSSASTITASNGGNTTSLAFQTPTANVTYRFLTAIAGTFDICTSVGNCAGAGGGVTTPGGTPGTVAKFTASGTVGDSILTESGTTMTVGGTLAVTTALQAPSLDTTSSVALGIGTTNATAINLNQNTVLAASKSFTITGGNTASRPAIPTEGMMYYDTTTKALLTYANGKWQSDRNTAMKTVAMGTATGCSGTSPVASQNPDAADFVSTSCTSSQTVINNAIAALPAAGGTVYLMDGTYIVDGTVSIPSNVALAGQGTATILKFSDTVASSTIMVQHSNDTSGNSNITIRDFKIDGNGTVNTNSLTGIRMGWTASVGSGSGSTAVPGATITGMTLANFRSLNVAVYLRGANSKITNNNFTLNASNGTALSCSNTSDGILIANNHFAGGNYAISGCPGTVITGNDFTSTGNMVYGGTPEVISNNTFTSPGTNAIGFIEGNGAVITGNYFTGGSSAVYIAATARRYTIADNHINGGNGINVGSGGLIDSSITDNTFYSTNAAHRAIILTAASTNNTLSNNTFIGSMTAPISDAAPNTIYNNQQNATGGLVVKPLAGVAMGTTTATNTLTAQGSIKTTQLPAPTAPTLSTSGTTGSTSYSYVVTALDGYGETTGSTTATIATGNATLTASNRINLALVPVGGAVQYKIYRTASAGTPSSTGLIGTIGSSTLTFSDTGLAASGSVPGSNSTGGASFGGAVTINTQANTAAALLVQDASANAALVVSTNNYAGGANGADATLKVAMDSVTGRSINAAGTINASGADFAEYFYQAVPNSLKAGDVVCLSSIQKVRACAGADDTLVGVVSTKPGYVGNDIFDAARPGDTAPIAMLGQVPVKVSNANGHINAGDKLSASAEQPGVAVKATGSGYIIGVAMEAHDGSGILQLLIRPQYHTAAQNGANLYGDATFNTVNVGSLATLTDLRVTGAATIATLTVQRLVVAESLEVNGHIVTGGQTPVVAATDTPLTPAVSGSDTAGTISFTAPTDTTASGPLVRLDFAKRYAGMPTVVVSAVGPHSALAGPYVMQISEQGFIIGSNNPLTPGRHYQFNYHVIQ